MNALHDFSQIRNSFAHYRPNLRTHRIRRHAERPREIADLDSSITKKEEWYGIVVIWNHIPGGGEEREREYASNGSGLP
jgi:hypothetical protein